MKPMAIKPTHNNMDLPTVVVCVIALALVCIVLCIFANPDLIHAVLGSVK